MGKREPNIDMVLRDLSEPDSLMPAAIGSVDVQAWGTNYVQVMTFKDLNGSVCAQIACQKGKGTVKEYTVAKGERVIGIYGYMDSNEDIRGLGLLTAQVADESTASAIGA